MKLECVDGGYGKTKNKIGDRLYMFDSKVQIAINNDGTIIQLNGVNYQVGVGQDDICLDKSNSLVHQLCLLKSIAENTQDNEEINLMLDLPLAHYYNQDYRNQFKESMLQHKFIKYNGQFKTINIKRVEACPQGLSALYAYDENQYKNKIIGILDIGSLTVDGCVVDNLKPIKETIFSINLGTLILENKIKTALNQEFMLNIQDYEMPYIIQKGLSNVYGADMVIQNCIEEYFCSLKREMMAKNWSLETLDILGIGGGSILLNDMLSLHFKYTQSNNPIYDNVLGLWNIGEIMRFQIYISEKSEKNKKIIAHLKSQEDYSKYVRRLIEQDMSNNHPLTEEEIIELIKKYCKNSNNVNSKTTIENLFG